jgi:hypothetical protein
MFSLSQKLSEQAPKAAKIVDPKLTELARSIDKPVNIAKINILSNENE